MANNYSMTTLALIAIFCIRDFLHSSFFAIYSVVFFYGYEKLICRAKGFPSEMNGKTAAPLRQTVATHGIMIPSRWVPSRVSFPIRTPRRKVDSELLSPFFPFGSRVAPAPDGT
jgi:hypothetical protein